MFKVLILSNSNSGLLSFRKELLESLLLHEFSVVVVSPTDDRDNELINLGCKMVSVSNLSRRGKNPLKDLSLLAEYHRILRSENPDIVLTYTVKPNIYGGIVAAKLGIPYIVNITGLGTAVGNAGILQKLTVAMYKYAMRKVNTIFFQNEGNRRFFQQLGIQTSKHKIIPGSGANLIRFVEEPYPTDNKTRFLFVSRLMKQKGIEEYFAVAEHFMLERDDLEFHILGRCEEDYTSRLKGLSDNGVIIYHGVQKDVRPFVKDASCLIHPTYYPEGMSNVILEAASTGRPVITTRRYGCMEAVDDGVTGFLFPEKDRDALIDCINRFLGMSISDREKMGKLARKKMEKEFDRQIVIDTYLEEINKALN